MLAPGIDDPDLSVTFPEKFPVAWPRMAGDIIRTTMQTTMESSSLWDLVSASSIEIGHLVSTIVCSIRQNPFDSLAKVAFALTGLPRGYLTVRTGRSKVNASFARLTDTKSFLDMRGALFRICPLPQSTGIPRHSTPIGTVTITSN